MEGLAHGLERALRAKAPVAVLRDALTALTGPMSELVAALDRALPEETALTVVPVDTAELDRVCARLGALLAEDDSEASDLLDAHAELLHSAFPLQYPKIHEAIRAFDFPTAAQRLADAYTPST